MYNVNIKYFYQSGHLSITFIAALQAITLAAYCSQGAGFFLFYMVVIGIALFYLYQRVAVITHRLFSSYNSFIVENHTESAPAVQVVSKDPSTFIVNTYVQGLLLRNGFSEDAIVLVHHYMAILRDHALCEVKVYPPIPYHDGVSQNDLKHLAWNIGEVYGASGLDRARFVQLAFGSWFQGTTTETIVRTLRDNRGGKRIPLFTSEEVQRMRGEFFALKRE